jgi:TonB family protein
MSEHSDEAQRILEKKALANVRGLVDSIERQDRERSPQALKGAIKLVALLLVISAIAVTAVVVVHRMMPRPGASMPTAQMDEAQYVEQALGSVLRLANKKNQSVLAGLEGRVEITMSVRADGGIDSIAVTGPSKNAVVDRAVSQLVKLVGSFGALPLAVRKSSDVLVIVATFRVERPDLDRSILVVERYSTTSSRAGSP